MDGFQVGAIAVLGPAIALQALGNFRQGAAASPAKIAPTQLVPTLGDRQELPQVALIGQGPRRQVPNRLMGIDYGPQVGTIGPVPHIRKVGCYAAGGGKVERVDQLVLIGEHLTVGGGDRPIDPGRGRFQAAIDLAMGVGTELVAIDRKPPQIPQGIGTRQNRLGLQGGFRCAGPNFVGNHAAQIGFRGYGIDDCVAAIGVALELQGTGKSIAPHLDRPFARRNL